MSRRENRAALEWSGALIARGRELLAQGFTYREVAARLGASTMTTWRRLGRKPRRCITRLEVARARRLRAAGFSPAEVAVTLGFSARTIGRYAPWPRRRREAA